MPKSLNTPKNSNIANSKQLNRPKSPEKKLQKNVFSSLVASLKSDPVPEKTVKSKNQQMTPPVATVAPMQQVLPVDGSFEPVQNGDFHEMNPLPNERNLYQKPMQNDQVLFETIESNQYINMEPQTPLHQEYYHEPPTPAPQNFISQDDSVFLRQSDTQKFINDLTNKSKKIVNQDGSISFQCVHDNCGKMLKSWPAMRKHAATHGPKSYECQECGKAFVENSKLRRHMLVHSGERPYHCMWPGCGKKFSLDFNLKTHLKIHCQQSPFTCPIQICQRKFPNGSVLRNHVMQEHVNIALEQTTQASSEVLFFPQNQANGSQVSPKGLAPPLLDSD